MALLKSRALELEDIERERANECYAIIDAWQVKSNCARGRQPVMTPTVALPAIPEKEDTTPFGYDYSHLPARGGHRQRRWSEL